MANLNAIIFVSILGLGTLGRANAQTGGVAFPLIEGKTSPLTLHLKDLDSTWRVFSAGSGSYESIIASAMSGGTGSRVYTKGETVSVGAEVFLVTYKPDAPDMSALLATGGIPKPKVLMADTVLRLSLLNLHALSSMDGIRVFDLKEQTAGISIPAVPIIKTTTKQSTGGGDDSDTPTVLKNGSMAPDFTVHDDKGAAVKLSAFRGKVVVLDFWSTWCGPCQQSLPSTNKLAAEYANKIVVLGVNVWDTKEEFHKWLPSHKSFGSIKFAIDTRPQPKDVATGLYHVSGIPTQFVIDKKGRIVKSIVGFGGDESELKAGIKTALGR